MVRQAALLAAALGIMVAGVSAIESDPTVNTPDKAVVTSPALGEFNLSTPVHATPDGKHYMVDVQLGTDSNVSNTQVSRLIIDSGSGDMVVFGRKHCDFWGGYFDHDEGGRGCYDVENSSTMHFNPEGQGKRLAPACQFDLPEHPGAFCKQALAIDGHKAEVSCELAWEDIQFGDLRQPARFGTSPPAETEGAWRGSYKIRADICVVNDTTLEDGASMKSTAVRFKYWNHTQGTMGLFYHLCTAGRGEAGCSSPFPPLIATLPTAMQDTFTLDLNPPEQPSWMHFGAPKGGWGEMQWGETQPMSMVGPPAPNPDLYPYAFHAFEVFELGVCGANFLSNYSSHWSAMVDTGASCLSLPEEFFAMLLAWVPALECVQEWVAGVDFTDCIEQPCTDTTGRRNLTICYIREGFRASDLPTLSFRLAEAGEDLFLPLSGLVLNDRPSGRPRVCVAPMEAIELYRAEAIKYLLMFPKISFGTLALRNLVTAFDMRNMMVGMKNKRIPPAVPSALSCAAPADCRGAQDRYDALNICIDPACEMIYFHALDPEAKQCRITDSFLISAVIILSAMALAEVALVEIYAALARKLTSTFATSS